MGIEGLGKEGSGESRSVLKACSEGSEDVELRRKSISREDDSHIRTLAEYRAFKRVNKWIETGTRDEMGSEGAVKNFQRKCQGVPALLLF